MQQGNYYVYIMASVRRCIYIGVSNNLRRRVAEHKSGQCPGFTKRYQCKKLVYFEYFTDVQFAIRREKELKGWKRMKKITLIEQMNPNWADLFIRIEKG